MSDVLVIRLDHFSAASQPVAAQWLLIDTAGARLGAVLQGSLTDAGALAKSHRTIVLVPGAEVLHTELLLPPLKGGARLSQIVPFALEEHLAGDVDTAHFAVGKRNAAGATPVDVVSHECMTTWLQSLRAAGIQPDALYADSSMIPGSVAQIAVLIEDGRVTLHDGNRPPATLDIAPLSDAIALQLNGIDAQAPLTVYVSETEYDANQPTIEGVRELASNVQIKLLPDGALPVLALQAAQVGTSGINLLQGPYAIKTQLQHRFKPWRAAAALLAGMVLLNLVTKGVELAQLKRTERSVDQQISQTYAQALPGAAVNDAREARRQFESRLFAAQSGSGTDSLMLGLSTLSEAVTQIPDTQLDALSYRDQNIDLRITAASVDALDKIRQQAQSKGLQAEIQSANPRDNKVEGRMQFKTIQQKRAANSYTSSRNGV